MITFHYCRLFESKIENLSYSKTIKSKFLDLSKTTNLNSVNNVSRFGSDIYVFKSFSPLYRIIIQKETINIDKYNEKLVVYFVRDIFTNKEFEYTYAKVIAPALDKNKWLSSNELSQGDIYDFIKNYEEEKQILSRDRALIPDNLTSWLNTFEIKVNNEIFETEDWINYSQNDSEVTGMNDKYVNRLNLLLKNLIKGNNTHSEVLRTVNDIEIRSITDDNYGIIYAKVENNSNNLFVLFNGANILNEEQYWKESQSKIINSQITLDNDIEFLSRLAYRAYPKWAVNDENLWFSIQKSSEMSNLSLTQEQISFLKNFKFPYYINGQAGSGKSTMLNYIFANVYIDKCLGYISGDIIYLTENESLIEDSKHCVIELLSNNPKMNGLDTSDISLITDKFSTFKIFLRGLLSKEDQILFKDDKYLNYPLFKYLYENSYLAKHIINKYTAEECWFTIITYIYGYLDNKIVTSSEYESQIPRESLIIPKDKFDGIEKHVLPFYKTLINEEGYWDKLKIIRFIQDNRIKIPNYSVVICDEAQDFCRVELKFILRLSEFLNYDLSQTDQVPIVFAGDPNQTVNPTGFRESEITSMIFEELNNFARFNIKKNESVYNPKFNYRSSKSVVDLANFVQYYRKKNLGIKIQKPQETKKLEHENIFSYNTFISYEEIYLNPNLKNDLIDKLKYKIFIVPVDTQSKDEYIKSNKIFSERSTYEIKTSVEAKGAEYDQVVLFGFGEYYTNNFNSLSQQDSDSDEHFKIRFFFNKLYVGITRARTELLIIDSAKSINSFWKQLIEIVSITENSWSSLCNVKSDIILFNPNSIGHVIKSTKEDALKNANNDKERGEYEQNSARLRVAATQFIKLGFEKEGYECLALSEKILKRYLKAANYYINPIFENTRINDAAQCFFLGRHFKELVEETNQMINSPEQDVRIVISRLMSGNIIMNTDINILSKNKNIINGLINEIEWRHEIIGVLESNYHKIKEKEFKELYVDILFTLATSKDIKLWETIGEIYFSLRKFELAVESWNYIDFYNNEKYIIAKIEIAKSKRDIENQIIWLDELYKCKNENSYLVEIQEVYNNHKSFKSNKSTYYYSILRSYLLDGKFTDVITLCNLMEFNTNKDEEYSNGNFYNELVNIENLNSTIRLLFIERLFKITYNSNQNISDLKWLSDLNLFYNQISRKYSIPFIEYSLIEVQNLSDQIKQLNVNPTNHLTAFSVSNFRQYKEISLDNLGKFNLILGNNNVGKTSLLESLLFCLPFEKYVQELSNAYIERTNLPRYKDAHNLDYYNLNIDFFNDFINFNSDKHEIIYKLTNRRNIWNYKIEEIRDVNINAEKNDYIKLRCNTENHSEDILLNTFIDKIKYSKNSTSQYIPYGKGFNNELAEIYLNFIDIKKTERDNFVKSIRIFIPQIERIIVNTKLGQILIEEIDKEAIPLHQYGEGSIKLFRILLQIAVQSGKKILIDEIDSGIHYSNFTAFWKNIIQFCDNYDVQIFATTHNFECINYFKEILKESEYERYKDDSRIITLRQLPNNHVKAYTRIYEEFEYEMDNNFEIRGGEIL